VARSRASSPKFQVLNTALMTATSGMTLTEARKDTELWGRLVESAIGAHLANAEMIGECEVYYWRERNQEVDFVVLAKKELTAIEVKSGRAPQTHPGIAAFDKAFKPQRSLLVGGDGIALEDFLMQPVRYWVGGNHGG
jgi:predicted AAA+ superfamily ATPase